MDRNREKKKERGKSPGWVMPKESHENLGSNGELSRKGH